MKKSIKKMAVVAMMLVAGSTMTVNAQLLSEKPRVHLGIRGGVSASSYSGDGIKSKIFPMGGFAVDFKVAPLPLYLESGLYYVNRGYKLDIPDDYYYDDESTNNQAIEMPIVVSYHYYLNDKMSIQPFFGGFISQVFDGPNDDLDYGLRLGTGFNYGRAYASIGYDFGLKNWGEDGHSSKSGLFFFNIGFNFLGSK